MGNKADSVRPEKITETERAHALKNSKTRNKNNMKIIWIILQVAAGICSFTCQSMDEAIEKCRHTWECHCYSYNEAAELCLLKYSVGWTLEYDEDFDSACLYGEGYYGYYMEGGDLEDCS